MKKNILDGITILFVLFISIGNLSAQTYRCGTDELNRLLIQQNPLKEQIQKQQNQEIYNATINQPTPSKHNRTGTYTVPVVVHIIHNNGPENISDATVIAGINNMNVRFQNGGSYYDSAGTDIGIQFCLASVDPNGNPTTGITRNVSTYTNMPYYDYTADTTMKQLNNWIGYLYMNIWVVASIGGGSESGYSTFPNALSYPEDGIVIEYNAFTSYVLAHETGHYFNLQHTFFGGCNNQNCLLDGDYVCDTPPDNTSDFSACPQNSCTSDMNDTSGLNPFTIDMNDSPNYMDYTPCPNLFTAGQGQRMTNALTGTRHLLLLSQGCGTNPPIGPPVGYYHYTIAPCQSGVVTFIDSSANYPYIRKWDFNNDGVWDAVGHTVTNTFTTGTHTVRELVIGVGGTDTVYHTFYVNAQGPYYPIGSFSSNFTDDGAGNYHSCVGSLITFYAYNGVHYLWSNGDTTQGITFAMDTAVTVWVQSIDSAGRVVNSQTCFPIHLTPRPSIPHDSIYASDTTYVCQGVPVHLHSTVDSAQYTYQWYDWIGAISGANDSALEAYPDVLGEFFYLNISNSYGCTTQSNQLILNGIPFPVQQGLTANGNVLTTPTGFGKVWFRDSVVIASATGMTYTVTQDGCYSCGWYFPGHPQCITLSDSVFCFTTTGLNQLNSQDVSFNIYPNPANDRVDITIVNADKTTDLYICNPLGQIIYQRKLTASSISIPLTDVASGLYIINLKSPKGEIIKKLVVNH